MSRPQSVRFYEVGVGDLWVTIDFEALAVYVRRGGPDPEKGRVLSTQIMGNGFHVDYDKDGRAIGVEALGGR